MLQKQWLGLLPSSHKLFGNPTLKDSTACLKRMVCKWLEREEAQLKIIQIIFEIARKTSRLLNIGL